MTRGNFVLITNTANWMSIQFNGDMYPSCNGKFVYHMLESVETYNDLAAAILKFDEERFGNARTVRNILDEAISKHALRLTRDRKAKTNLLTSADINDESRKII